MQYHFASKVSHIVTQNESVPSLLWSVFWGVSKCRFMRYAILRCVT